MTTKIGKNQRCIGCNDEELVLYEWRSYWLCVYCYSAALRGRYRDAPIAKCDACGAEPSALMFRLSTRGWYCVHCGAFLGLKTRPLSEEETEEFERVLFGKCK